MRKWRLALAASCIFHAAVAALFLQTGDESIQIEGSENSGIALLGDAPEDQISAGMSMVDSVNVTMITMLEATSVETVAAQAVEVTEAAERVETVASLPATSDVLQPVETEVERPAEPEPAVSPVETATERPVESVLAPSPAEVAPAEPLRTERIPAASEHQSAEIVTSAEAAPSAEAPAAPVKHVDTIEPTRTFEEPPIEILHAAALDAAEMFVAEAGTPPAAAETSNAEPAGADETQEPVAEPKKPAAKPLGKEPAARPEKKAEPTTPAERVKAPARKQANSAAGSGGRNHVDARKGRADGEARGTAAASSKPGRNSSAGNAATSNYPGKVAAKLRRALRYPAEARRSRLRGEVRVSFVVSAGGGVGSVRIARSSGSPILDTAALETVRRAAPFPPIPDGAGRSNWPFTVPLAFTR